VATLGAAAMIAALSACGAGTSGGSSNASAAENAAAKELGIDLRKCDASFTELIKGDITIGQSIPLSGPNAVLSFLAGGLKAAIESQNDAGGIDGHKIKLIQQDDQYQPDKTLAVTRDFIDRDKVSAVVSTLGTSNALAVADLVKESCTPFIAAGSGASAVIAHNFPWIAGGSLSYGLEPLIWAKYLKEKYPAGAKIAEFAVNNDAGKEFQEDLRAAIKGTNLTIVKSLTYEQADNAAPSSAVTTLKASGADVLVTDMSGGMCVSMPQEVQRQGWVIPTISGLSCAGFTAQAGAAANGIIMAQWLKRPNSPRWADDAGVTTYKERMKKYVPDVTIDTGAAQAYTDGEIFIEAAKKAAASDLGLSPLGILYATWHLDFQPTMTMPGTKVITNGSKDVIPLETAELARFDSKTSEFEPIETVGFEGKMTP
jgi:ABC-type branched-subunit amino acid transport system substrate-binding protein